MLKAAFDYWLGFSQSINFRQSVDGTVRHLTPLIADRTIDFRASTPTSKPFCISLHFKKLHGPWTYMDPDRPNLYEDAAVTPRNSYIRQSLPAFLRNSLNGTENGQWLADSEKEF